MPQVGNGSWAVDRALDISRHIGVCTGYRLCTSQLRLCNKFPHPSNVCGSHKPLLPPVSEDWTSGHLLNGLGAPDPFRASSREQLQGLRVFL